MEMIKPLKMLRMCPKSWNSNQGRWVATSRLVNIPQEEETIHVSKECTVSVDGECGLHDGCGLHGEYALHSESGLHDSTWSCLFLARMFPKSSEIACPSSQQSSPNKPRVFQHHHISSLSSYISFSSPGPILSFKIRKQAGCYPFLQSSRRTWLILSAVIAVRRFKWHPKWLQTLHKAFSGNFLWKSRSHKLKAWCQL